MLSNSAPDRCSGVPMPEEAYSYLSGLALSSAISSPTVFTLSEGCTTTTLGTFTRSETGAKSFTGSYGILV